ncbi:MAG: hypothetical protein U0269_17590 [Polyangiales bacterium]
MSHTHVIRFVRALAVGVTAGSIAVAACSTSSTSAESNSNGSSSGNESSAQRPDAGTTASSAGEYATPNDPCAMVGQVASTASRPPLLCTCTARDAGSPTWDCNSMGEIVVGPLPPPDMPA